MKIIKIGYRCTTDDSILSKNLNYLNVFPSSLKLTNGFNE